MAKIDLIQDRWVDIVFEGKNQAYGAYVLRKGTGKRNAFAIVCVLLLIILCYGAILGLNAYDEYQKRQEAILAEVELSKLQDKKKEDEPKKKEEVIIPEKKQIEVIQNTVKFTAPVIKKDDEVKEENMLRDQETVTEDTRKTGGQDFDEGTNDKLAPPKTEENQQATPPPPEPPKEETKIYDVVEQMPSYPGGMAALMSWLGQNIHYPTVATENGIEGRVIVQFVVGKDGKVSDAKVVRGVDPSLDKEAVRVVKSMPKWIPGKQNGQAVNCKYTLPVVFKLQ